MRLLVNRFYWRNVDNSVNEFPHEKIVFYGLKNKFENGTNKPKDEWLFFTW
jgi:hypothetical protein